MIAEALTIIQLPGHCRGHYLVQADLAAVHATARSAADTDWPRIVRLYDELLQLLPSPVVALNRAIAVGMATGPWTGWPLSTTSAASQNCSATIRCPPPAPTCWPAPASQGKRRSRSTMPSSWPHRLRTAPAHAMRSRAQPHHDAEDPTP